MDLLTSIKTGETLVFNIRGIIDIIAVEIIRDLQPGQQLSIIISEEYDKILLEVKNLIIKKVNFAEARFILQ